MNHEFEEKDLAGLLKKTRRKTFWRNTLLGLLSSVVVLGGGSYANKWLLDEVVQKTMVEISLRDQISGPNEYRGEYTHHHELGEGTAQYATYKQIEGIPVPWSRQTVRYDLFGSYTRTGVNDMTLFVNDERAYSVEAGQREVMFYHPEMTYAKPLLVDFPLLDEIPQPAYVEMALSLDRGYTTSEVNGMLPAGVHPVWYWVDTYDEEGKKMLSNIPVTPPFVYGFDEDATRFMDALKQGVEHDGDYVEEFEQVLSAVQERGVKVIGVVVTGTPEALKQAEGIKAVKAAVLGAVARRY